jgi:hypothetical protein
VLSIATALFGSADGPDPVVHFVWIAVASIAVLGSLIAVAGLWTATGVYAVVFWCFHFGLVAMIASGFVGPVELSPWDQSWVLGPFVADAALMALAGSLAFAAGAALVYARRRPALGTVKPAASAAPVHPHGPAGSILVFAAIGVWSAIVVMTSGLSGFLSSYGEYLEAISEFGAVSGVVWLVLGCGLVLSVTGKPGRLRSAAAAAFGALAVVTLPIGLRGEVMFRAMAALVAAARCGRVLSSSRAIALGLALLVSIPLIREIRQTGLRDLPDAIPALRLYEAFAEMGASLHPVEKVVRWREEGDPLEQGGSYWAPIERAAARLLPGVESAAAEDDLRIMNILVSDRVGPIGFSPVAEAYRNFGALGVVLVLAALGAVLAAIDTIRDPRIAVLTIAVAYPALLANVRNSFMSVPAQCAASLAIVLALGVARHVLGSVVGKPYARPAYIRSEI